MRGADYCPQTAGRPCPLCEIKDKEIESLRADNVSLRNNIELAIKTMGTDAQVFIDLMDKQQSI
jgi:Zn ribbon nucleic-acid-binding protein